MTKHYHHTNDGSRMVITMTIPEYSYLMSTMEHVAGSLDSAAFFYKLYKDNSTADYIVGHARRIRKQIDLIENCPQGETVLDYTLVR